MRNTTFRRRYERLLGSDPEAAAREELENHIALRVEGLMRQGRTEAEARAQDRVVVMHTLDSSVWSESV